MNDSYQSQCKLARSSTEPIVKQKTDDVVRDAPSSDGQKELHPSFNHLVGNADQQNSGMSSTSDEGNLPQFRSLELEVLHPNLPPVDLPYAFWCISMDTLLGPSSNRSSASECTSHEDSEDPDMSYAVEDIDADGDVHWASCYANDLYEHFKTQERIMSPIPGFMERQSNISESNRANLINIMVS